MAKVLVDVGYSDWHAANDFLIVLIYPETIAVAANHLGLVAKTAVAAPDMFVTAPKIRVSLSKNVLVI